MIIPLLYLVSLVNALWVFQEYFGTELSESTRFACLPVSVEDGQKGKITASLRSISLKENEDFFPDIEFMIFKLRDFDKFDRFIYRRKLRKESDLLIFANNPISSLFDNPEEFDIVEKEVYRKKIDYRWSSFYSSILNYYPESFSDFESGMLNEPDLLVETYEVSSSGLYCAWIMVDKDIARVGVHLEGVNSYGYLPPQIHFENIQLRYYLAITSVVLGLSVFSIYMARRSNNVIPTYFVHGVMIPSFVISILRYIYNLHANNEQLYNYGADPKFIQLLNCLDSIVQTVGKFIFLLIAMGLGSIYQNDLASSSSNERGIELPTRLKKRAVLLLATNLVFTCLKHVFTVYVRKLADFLIYLAEVLGDTNLQAFNFIVRFVLLVDSIFPLLWPFAALIYYIRTYQAIEGFKSANNVMFKKAVKSFKLSIIFIFALPIGTGIRFFVLTLNRVNAAGKTLENMNTRSDGEKLLIHEALYFSSNNPLIWTRYLYSIFTMCTVYVLWIMNSNNSKSKDENELGSYNQIPLTDLDETLKLGS